MPRAEHRAHRLHVGVGNVGGGEGDPEWRHGVATGGAARFINRS